MRKTILTILLATAMTAAGQKYVGGDISMLPEYEKYGAQYYDKSGVEYIAQAGGSVRDDHVIMTCDKYGIAMAFTGVRLFHH